MLLFFVASLLALCFLQPSAGIALWIAAALAVTGIREATRLVSSPRRWLRVAGWLAWAAHAGFHALIVFLAVVWGSRLTWAMPRWSFVLIAVLLAGTFRRRWRIPVALPIGVTIAVC